MRRLTRGLRGVAETAPREGGGGIDHPMFAPVPRKIFLSRTTRVVASGSDDTAAGPNTAVAVRAAAMSAPYARYFVARLSQGPVPCWH